MLKKVFGIAAVVCMLASMLAVGVCAAIGDNPFREVELNDSTALADRVYNDYTVLGSVRGADVDYFKFTLSTSSQVTLKVNGNNSDLCTEITDAGGTVKLTCKTAYEGGAYAATVTDTLSAGTYYIAVFNGSHQTQNSYTFYLTYQAHTHTYTKRVIKPTCTTQGYTSYTCSCGNSYQNSFINATGHTIAAGDAGTFVPPTCAEQGYMERICTVCHQGVRSNFVNALGHTYTDETDIFCDVCGYLNYAIGYPDTKEGEWYYEAVKYVTYFEFMTGYKNGRFGPADSLKRQDFVVALARIKGADLSAYESDNGGLSDVALGSYYAPAVAWAVDNQIVSGYQNGKFGVGDPITREQVCTILYRCAGSPAINDVEGTLSTYPDRTHISAFARTPMAWAVQNGVVSGMGNGTIAPVAGASRAQIAMILMRMHQKDLFDTTTTDSDTAA